MRVLSWLAVLISAASLTTAKPSRTSAKRLLARSASPFVSSSGNEFQVNGSTFKFIGTNAYWLSSLNSDDDIKNTLSSIAAAGIKVVRTWGFNDVDTIPENGTWFQLISNGVTSVNTGPNGLQRLDSIVKHAGDMGMYVLIPLTNNWNPLPGEKTTSPSRRDAVTGNQLPRNYLSNDYGGMDTYVRSLGSSKQHDEFYTNPTILNAFTNYTTQIVSRYVNSPTVFGWELANDARCSSSLPASSSCNPHTITMWSSVVAKHIASIDPNHLVSSGTQGFLCTGCPKLFPKATAPPVQPSAKPGTRRNLGPLTKARLLKERSDARKRTREIKKRAGQFSQDGVKIRGRWVSTPTRRQDSGLGSAFDGSQGVDSEDIINIPEIGFGSAQLFPDQDQYGPNDPSLSPFDNTVQQGVNWIQQQAQTGATFNKPVTFTGFGLVTQGNAQNFVPFNTTTPVDAPTSTAPGDPPSSQPIGVTDAQRDDAYTQWISAGILSGINGLAQYQWGQSNLTTSPETPITSDPTGNTQSPNQDQNGVSPNDGYSISGSGQNGALQSLSGGIQQIGQN